MGKNELPRNSSTIISKKKYSIIKEIKRYSNKDWHYLKKNQECRNNLTKLTLRSNFAKASRLKADRFVSFRWLALPSDLLRSTSNCFWVDNGVARPVEVPSKYGEPIIPVIFEIPISDNSLHIAANV